MLRTKLECTGKKHGELEGQSGGVVQSCSSEGQPFGVVWIAGAGLFAAGAALQDRESATQAQFDKGFDLRQYAVIVRAYPSPPVGYNPLPPHPPEHTPPSPPPSGTANTLQTGYFSRHAVVMNTIDRCIMLGTMLEIVVTDSTSLVFSPHIELGISCGTGVWQRPDRVQRDVPHCAVRTRQAWGALFTSHVSLPPLLSD